MDLLKAQLILVKYADKTKDILNVTGHFSKYGYSRFIKTKLKN
jgi:hypothetical protein